MVCLCKPAIYKLKILGGGKFEYYKSIGGTTKRGEPNFESPMGKAKFKFSGGKTLEKTMFVPYPARGFRNVCNPSHQGEDYSEKTYISCTIDKSCPLHE